ncbi:MAG: N-acetylmuramoyl-L-alanine amidase [Acidobacteriota bacterium]
MRAVHVSRARAVFAAVAVAAASGAFAAPRVPPPFATMTIEEGIDIVLLDGNRIQARVMPRDGESYAELGVRVTGKAGSSSKIREASGNRPLARGIPAIVPWDAMKADWRVKALKAFFPKDEWSPDGVRHIVRFPTKGATGETRQAVALWYAGATGAVGKLRETAARKDRLVAGDVIVIPASVVAADLRASLPSAVPSPPPASEKRSAQKEKEKERRKKEPLPPEEPDLVTEDVPAGPAVEPAPLALVSAEPGEAAGPEADAAEAEEAEERAAAVTPRGFEFEDDSRPGAAFAFVEGLPLEFRKDDRGPYAAYYLHPGEAIYSAVVVRFTGRVDSDEVNQLSELIAVRSGITDVTDIPIGYRIKIPLEYLLPEYQPPGSPEREAAIKSRQEAAKVKRPRETQALAGVAIILDAGHGGEDVGAMANGVWESDYVYDIMCRAKRILETDTAADVFVTIKDAQNAFAVFDRGDIPRNKAEEILTTPPYRPVLGQPGVHFRWYLANSYFRKLVKDDRRSDYVVFTSFHADSLHPSLRGTMIYVPGKDFRTSRFSRATGLFASRREVAEAPVVSFSSKDLVRSEGLSRQLAASIVTSFQDAGLAVHKDSPVRDHVIRSGRSWAPAVIKYSQVPAAILEEVCHLNNVPDAKNIRAPTVR